MIKPQYADDAGWPEPPLPLEIDWDKVNEATRDYRIQAMVFYLVVGAAQSLVQALSPTRLDPYENADGEKVPGPLLGLRDISIGLGELHRNGRVFVDCRKPPGAIQWIDEYFPQWDINSDTGVEDYEGATVAAKEHNFL